MMRRPRVGSLFSGVGGFEMGMEAAGFEVAWQVEIDKDAVSVLARHWPDVPRYGDIATVDPADLAPVDVVTFGSPCQDFSVAGKRAGLVGERSGLFAEATRVIAGLRPKPAFCLWENVPGALSASRGRDFGAVLDALADIGALDIAWRILDARHWGVPQRRRRIFLVADFGSERAASILFESESSGGDSAAGGEAGQGAARDAADGAGVAGVFDQQNSRLSLDDACGTLQGEGMARQNRGFLVAAAFGGNRSSGPIDVATAGNAHGGPHGRLDFESETFIVADTVRSHPRPGSNSVGNLTIANSVTASAGHHGHSSPRGDGSDNLVAVAISENQRAEVLETPYAHQLSGAGGKPGQGYQAVREGMAVRRLTPRECERLMGFADDHTRYRADGSEIPDGSRYRMIGNGVCAPVAQWIASRMRTVLEQDSHET